MSDTTPRDRLAQEIAEALNVDHAPDGTITRADAFFWDASLSDAKAAVEVMIRAGWRPPARVVTTVEELDALVAHTVVRYCTRYGWGTAEKVACDRWWPAGVVVYLTNTHVLHHGPATVLYEPEEGE